MLIKSKMSLLITLLVIGFSSHGNLVFADTLNAEQVKALFTDKTTYATHVRKDFDITTYFASDGTLISIRKGDEQWTGKWRVESDGKHCIRLNDPYSGVAKIERCMIVKDDGGTYKRFKIKKNGDLKHIITYKRFADGNPENLK